MIDDETLIAALRLASGHDRVPPHVSTAARHAYALRAPGAVTAPLVDTPRPSGVRSADRPRMFHFRAPGLAVEVEFTVRGGLVDLAGRVLPSLPEGRVEIRTPSVTETRSLSPIGHFAAAGLPPGWFSILVDRSPDPPVTTSWTRVRP